MCRILRSAPYFPVAGVADTVRNVDAWYDAFRIQPGRRLYLAPEARVRVW